MKKVRIGNDVRIRWQITRNGEPEKFEGRKLTVKLLGPFGTPTTVNYSLEGNAVLIDFFGRDQVKTGKYMALLIENEGEPGMFTVDHAEVVELVRYTAEEGGESCSNVTLHQSVVKSDIGHPSQGMSAYEIARRNGFVGSEADWLESLIGEPGQPGKDGCVLYPKYSVNTEMELIVEAEIDTNQITLENGNLILNI